MRGKFYFSTRDLVTIAILSALGGVLSVYIGYLGNLMNTALGVPFGAGQIMAGLHVYWMIVAYALIPRFGTATMVGILKGTMELFVGSTHGVPIVFISFVEGLLVDLTLSAFRRQSTVTYCLAGALGASSNVFAFQLLYFAGVPFSYILLIASMAAISGAIFGGYFGQGSYQVLIEAGIVKSGERTTSMKKINIQRALTIGLAVALIGGAGIYYTVVYKPFEDPMTCRVSGQVDNPFSFKLTDFEDSEITIVAELKGEYTYIPPQEYTGVPLHIILEQASPNSQAERVRVIASDGYEARFDLGSAMDDDRLLLIKEGNSLRLVAGDYAGQYWVKQVYEIRIE